MHHHGWLVFFGVVTLGIVAIALSHGNRAPQATPFEIQQRLVPTSPKQPVRI